MHRTQILLEKEQYLALRELANQTGKSMGELIREFVRVGLGKMSPKKKGGEDSQESLKGFIEEADLTGRDHDQVLYGEEG